MTPHSKEGSPEDIYYHNFPLKTFAGVQLIQKEEES